MAILAALAVACQSPNATTPTIPVESAAETIDAETAEAGSTGSSEDGSSDGTSASGDENGADSAVSQAPREERAMARSSNDGSYYVAFDADPTTIPLNEMFSLEVDVFDGEDRDRAAIGVALAADADMPAHRHGMVRVPRITEVAPGRFQVEGMLFHMPGRWELYLDVTRAGITERAQFDIDID